MCCTRLAEHTGCKQSPKNRHLGTITQLRWAICLQLRHVSTIEKKLVKHQYLLHMSPQYGELRPTSSWDPSGSLKHPCKFQWLSRFGSITARHSSIGHQYTLRHWRAGATYIWQGGHHDGHWHTFLLVSNNFRCSAVVLFCPAAQHISQTTSQNKYHFLLTFSVQLPTSPLAAV